MTVKKLSELILDEHNANLGTERGVAMLDKSLRQYGAGRSILVDKHGTVIAGNKTLERAIDVGLEDVVVVQTDGSKLVAVQRMDLDLATDPAARELAYADNRVGQVSLDFDVEQLAADIEMGIDLSGLWKAFELNAMQEAVGIDYDELWKGMPEFEQEDKLAWQTVKVHFANVSDRQSFAELVGQNVTDKTKYVWYPKQKRQSSSIEQYTDES